MRSGLIVNAPLEILPSKLPRGGRKFSRVIYIVRPTFPFENSSNHLLDVLPPRMSIVHELLAIGRRATLRWKEAHQKANPEPEPEKKNEKKKVRRKKAPESLVPVPVLLLLQSVADILSDMLNRMWEEEGIPTSQAVLVLGEGDYWKSLRIFLSSKGIATCHMVVYQDKYLGFTLR